MTDPTNCETSEKSEIRTSRFTVRTTELQKKARSQESERCTQECVRHEAQPDRTIRLIKKREVRVRRTLHE